MLKQLDRYASLNHNMPIAADQTPVEGNHAAHACRCIVREQYLLSDTWRPT